MRADPGRFRGTSRDPRSHPQPPPSLPHGSPTVRHQTHPPRSWGRVVQSASPRPSQSWRPSPRPSCGVANRDRSATTGICDLLTLAEAKPVAQAVQLPYPPLGPPVQDEHQIPGDRVIADPHRGYAVGGDPAREAHPRRVRRRPVPRHERGRGARRPPSLDCRTRTGDLLRHPSAGSASSRRAYLGPVPDGAEDMPASPARNRPA